MRGKKYMYLEVADGYWVNHPQIVLVRYEAGSPVQHELDLFFKTDDDGKPTGEGYKYALEKARYVLKHEINKFNAKKTIYKFIEMTKTFNEHTLTKIIENFNYEDFPVSFLRYVLFGFREDFKQRNARRIDIIEESCVRNIKGLHPQSYDKTISSSYPLGEILEAPYERIPKFYFSIDLMSFLRDADHLNLYLNVETVDDYYPCLMVYDRESPDKVKKHPFMKIELFSLISNTTAFEKIYYFLINNNFISIYNIYLSKKISFAYVNYMLYKSGIKKIPKHLEAIVQKIHDRKPYGDDNSKLLAEFMIKFIQIIAKNNIKNGTNKH